MEAQVDAWRRGEYYGEVRKSIPDDSVVIGQDLVNRQMLAEEPALYVRMGKKLGEAIEMSEQFMHGYNSTNHYQ